jgi:MerR family transcriptional regulator/heat shock protein HspR
MSESIISREKVAEELAVPFRSLIRYEARGLVRPVQSGSVEGYGPAEIRRLWTIVSFQRDLGINLAGVEAILKLHDHLVDLHHQLDRLAGEFREALEDGASPNHNA